MTPPRRTRILFYVQHLLGIGHQARAAAITRAMGRHGMDVFYVSGGFSETKHALDGAQILQLPPARSADATFGTLLDENNQPVDTAWEERRREALLNAFESIQPDAVLIESFPFGRRRFRFELLPLLQTIAGQVPVAASVRDILVAKNDPKRTQWVVDTITSYFDAVIVHGDPNIAAFGETFAGAEAIEDRLIYSGYVTSEAAHKDNGRRTGVVVSAGGGAVGGQLLRTAIAARPLTQLPEAPWQLITGPNLPKSDREALLTPENVTIDTYIENFRDTLCKVAVSVSQAGYNTVMDLFATRTRSVLVPFSQHGETEQSYRAELLAQRGDVQFLPEANLSPSTLARAIDSALESPPPDPIGIDLGGAARTAEIMAKLVSGRPFTCRL